MRTVGGPGASPRTSSVQGSSHQSRAQPVTLDDLERHREALLTSGNEAVRLLVQKVADLHNQLAASKLTPEQHGKLCYVVLEAAAMLEGSSDVDEKTLERVGLAGLSPSQRQIPQGAYVGIADDLKVQLDEVHGVVAKRRANPESGPEPEPHPFPSPLLGGPGLGSSTMPLMSGSAEFGGSHHGAFYALAGMSTLVRGISQNVAVQPLVSLAIQGFAARHIEQRNLERRIPELDVREEGFRNVDREVWRHALEVHDGTRADPAIMDEAIQAVAGGEPVAEVVERLNLRNPLDVQQLRDFALDLAIDELG